MRGRTAGLILMGVVAASVVAAVVLAGPAPSGPVAGGASATPGIPSTAAASPGGDAGSSAPSPSATAVASPSVAPSPTPVLVPAPLTGLMVAPALAARHPIAVMIDDQAEARPQSGFNAASIVWQAPAEGGIPRYMMVFGEGDPPSVGPVRSSREYFITWAAEWGALYVHVGGSPQAMATLAASGTGQLVFDGDEYRWGGTYLWRIAQRFPPHNVYTDGKHLRALATRVGATAPPAGAAWTFGPAAPLADRPAGATISITYPVNQINYRYDRDTNSYLRLVGGKPQVDMGDGRQVAPVNVVVMTVVFGPLNDGHPEKKRLEAQNIGAGPALIATNGVTIRGTWKKASTDAPTLFYGSDGEPVTLTAGQTFVQVVPPGTPVRIVAGSRVVEGPAGAGHSPF